MNRNLFIKTVLTAAALVPFLGYTQIKKSYGKNK